MEEEEEEEKKKNKKKKKKKKTKKKEEGEKEERKKEEQEDVMQHLAYRPPQGTKLRKMCSKRRSAKSGQQPPEGKSLRKLATDPHGTVEQCRGGPPKTCCWHHGFPKWEESF